MVLLLQRLVCVDGMHTFAPAVMPSSPTPPLHNTMHAQSSFDGLRATVPDIELNDKSPKVMILTAATEYIQRLKRRQQELLSTKEVIASDSVRLHARMRQLQAQINAHA